jgi:hypothetical protein
MTFQLMLLVDIVKVFQFTNAVFTPQVYAFFPVLLHPKDAQSINIGQ